MILFPVLCAAIVIVGWMTVRRISNEFDAAPLEKITAAAVMGSMLWIAMNWILELAHTRMTDLSKALETMFTDDPTEEDARVMRAVLHDPQWRLNDSRPRLNQAVFRRRIYSKS